MTKAPLIDKEMAAAVSGGAIAGLVATAANEEGVFYEAAFGQRSLAQPQQMTTDTIFSIASMTKAVTAFVINANGRAG